MKKVVVILLNKEGKAVTNVISNIGSFEAKISIAKKLNKVLTSILEDSEERRMATSDLIDDLFSKLGLQIVITNPFVENK